MLVVGLVAIVIWQLSFTAKGAKIDGAYGLRGLSGMHNDATFVYFLWYENLFPVASTLAVGPCEFHCDEKLPSGAPADLNKAAAGRVLKEHPESLVQDLGWTWNAGDRGKIFLYLPDVIMKGAPFAPSVAPTHHAAFILALAALFVAAWKIRRVALGALIVIFLGSDPLQLVEVYVHENVFGWSITTAVVLLALHLHLLASPRASFRRVIWLPFAVGTFMATVRTFRSEPMPLLLGPAFLYLGLSFVGVSQKGGTWARRIALAATLTAAFVASNAAWNSYFESKTKDAGDVLARIGGHPFPGSMRLHHHFWHPVYCGLGDFDTKHGYEWRDGAAVEYATPILQSRFHEHVPSAMFQDTRHNADEYLDTSFIYKRMPYSIPNYDEVVRDKVLADIKADPAWYAGILARRVWRALTETTPVSVATYFGWVSTTWLTGVTALALFVMCWLARATFAARLIAFTAPIVTTSIIVYSGGGVQLYGIYHLLAAAVLVLTVASAITRAARRARNHRQGEAP